MIIIYCVVVGVLLVELIRWKIDPKLDKTRKGETLLWYTTLRGERKFKKL